MAAVDRRVIAVTITVIVTVIIAIAVSGWPSGIDHARSSRGGRGR